MVVVVEAASDYDDSSSNMWSEERWIGATLCVQRSAMMGDVSRGDGGVELGNEHQQHNTLWPVRISVH